MNSFYDLLKYIGIYVLIRFNQQWTRELMVWNVYSSNLIPRIFNFNLIIITYYYNLTPNLYMNVYNYIYGIE